MPTKLRRQTSKQAVRATRNVPPLEHLESRILLAAFTWNGGAGPLFPQWDNPLNWGGVGAWPGQVALAGDTVAFNQTVAVEMDVNPSVASVTFNAQAGADSDVTFSFINNAATLTVANAVALNAVSGHNAGISMPAANAGGAGDPLALPFCFRHSIIFIPQ